MVKTIVISIKGVSKKHKKLLDKMWEFDTEKELQFWMSKLKGKKLRRAIVLKELIEIAVIDECVDAMTEFPDAETILDNLLSDF